MQHRQHHRRNNSLAQIIQRVRWNWRVSVQVSESEEVDVTDTTFDLGTNTSVPLSAIATDADGNVLSLPTEYSVDDPSLVNLTDNGDGTAEAARASADAAGSVKITAVVTNPDGSTITGTLSFSLSAQAAPPANAVNVEIVPGQPTA